MNKKGQFFLLAAVIISAVIISFGVGTNRAVVSEEPSGFYDFSYEVKREVGAVLDYEVYTAFDDGTNLTEFVDLLAKEIEERAPGSDFIFIYGDSSKMELKNYGSESVYADGAEFEGLGAGATSSVCLKTLCQDISEDVVDFASDTAPSENIVFEISRMGSTNVTVEIEGNVFDFPTSEHKQVIFIMQKNVGGDRHVIVD